MRELVVVPTYEERENVSRLLPAVLRQSPNLHVLVVDDASPDGTGERLDELASSEPRIHVRHRAGKLGLGTAYLEGFRWALESTDAEFVLQMDADLSHDPNDIPRLLAAAETADLVVGSRYKTGVNVVNWPLRRLLLSVLANQYARVVTGLPLRDVTGGFRCYRRSALEALPLDRMRSDGYAFMMELGYYAWRRGLRIEEVPIVFTDRVAGKSKLSRGVMFEAAWMAWRLRLTGGRGVRSRSTSAAVPDP